MIVLLIGILAFTGPALAGFEAYTYKCSSAMVCVDKNVCDQFGVISKSTVSLTPDEEAFRQPLVPCKKIEGGRGVCCRDPDYKDDWPTDQSTANPVFIRKVTTTTTTTTTKRPTPPPIINSEGSFESPGCPRRNRTALPDKNFAPFKDGDVEAGAGEFPWHGAVYSADGKFLCSCALTFGSTCTTTASCVQKFKPADLRVGVGLYNVKDPLDVAEFRKGDKNPQISQAKAIAFDPKYNAATGKYDIAIIHLQNNVAYNYYTKAICLDDFYSIPFEDYDDCVLTGWGNGDTLRWTDVVLLSEAECRRQVPGFDSNAQSCGRAAADACNLVETGGAFQCRETGKRNKRSIDVYLLKGTYSSVKCEGSQPIVTFSRAEFDWFKDALRNPSKYPLRG